MINNLFVIVCNLCFVTVGIVMIFYPTKLNKKEHAHKQEKGIARASQIIMGLVFIVMPSGIIYFLIKSLIVK
jgi:hypothetical protein